MKNCNAQEIDISLFLTKIIKSTYPKKSIDEPLYLFVDIKICNGKKISQKNIQKNHMSYKGKVLIIKMEI